MTSPRDESSGAAVLPRTMTVPPLIRNASLLLENMYDPGLGLFSYSTRHRNGAFEHVFDHPACIRYTINALCGIQKACRLHALSWDVPELIESFLSKHAAEVVSPADKGLLLYLLAEADHEARRAYARDLEQF